MSVPRAFCWSKFGTEAGEPAGRIIARKEYERQQNGGVFLWGIGNSIRPSLLKLVDDEPHPEVLFTEMLSQPKEHDVSPAAVQLWREATGIDGSTFELPEYSAVTSRVSGRRSHFALICRSAEPLGFQPDNSPKFRANDVRNILTGNLVGSSQVTSVVRKAPSLSQEGRSYSVAFRAELVYPYLACLQAPLTVSGSVHTSSTDTCPRETVDWLVGVRHQNTASSPHLALF